MLTSILSELNGASEAILASSVLSSDGLALASVLPGSTPSRIDEDTMGAMGSALMALGQKATMDLVGAGLDRVLVTGKAGSLLMTQAGPEMILAVVFKADTEAGAIFSHVRRAANDIQACAEASLPM